MAKKDKISGNNPHLRRFGLGILVLIQALALGIFGGVVYYSLVFYRLKLVSLVIAVLVIYFAGMYEEDRMKRKKICRRP